MADIRGAEAGVRDLQPGDLERVIAIDAAHVGRSRRRFFAKRFRAAERTPDDFIHLGADGGGQLVGFVLARVLRGEFGRDEPVAVLDVIDVDRAQQAHGCGRRLLTGLATRLRQRGVSRLDTEAEWTNHGLLSFFAASGFQLGRRVILERQVAAPLIEPTESV
jgi:GNAT superfamily N-acetyltransferase